MADGVTVKNTGGVDYDVATDEVAVNGGAVRHAAFGKLVDGRDGGTDGIPGDTMGLWTVGKRDVVPIRVTSGGLTIAATAYTVGDQVGTLFTFPNAARVSGGSGYVEGVHVKSAADTIGALDLVLFRDTVTLAADNAPFAISDADHLKALPIIQLMGAYDLGNNRSCQAFNIGIPYDCAGTSLYGALITRSSIAATPFAAVTDIQIDLWVARN